MKPKVFNVIVLWALLLALPQSIFADTFTAEIRKTEFSKTVEKEFSVGLTDKFKVSNKYGKVDIETWDKPQVSVKVVITINARNQEAANAAFDRIKIKFDQGSGYTSAITELESKKSSWSSWWSGGDSDNFRIDYSVNMPKGHSLDLSNKYGHSHVAAFEGNGNFTVKYGDLFTQQIGGNVELYLGYGNATMGSSEDVRAEVKYSKFRMEKIGNCNLTTKYSKIYINEVKDFKIYSGYDNFEIGTAVDVDYEVKYSDMDFQEVQRMVGTSKYSDIHLENCHKEARADLNYGALKIDKLHPGFETVDVQTNYAGVRIHIDPSASYKFSASTRYAGISYPGDMEVSRDIQSGNSKEVSGHHGSGNAGNIKISTNYGGIKVW